MAGCALFRNQKLAVQSILDKFRGENFVHPGCPVPVILQGPTGCGKSLTACRVAAELGVRTLVVIGPCVTRQAWEEAFLKVRSSSDARDLEQTVFLGSGLLVRRYNTCDQVVRQNLMSRGHMASRVINTRVGPRGYRYQGSEQYQRQFAYFNQTIPNDLAADDLFMSLPWHDKEGLVVCDSGNQSNGGPKEPKGRWMLVLDESHMICGKANWTVKKAILATISAALREDGGYLLMISATPISTNEERKAHLHMLGYGQYHNEEKGVYHYIHRTLRTLIIPRLPAEVVTSDMQFQEHNTEDVCWNQLLAQHHCVLQGDAPKSTILDIEARFYHAQDDLFSELRNCTTNLREIIKQRTFVDRHGEEKVRLDDRGYKNVAGILNTLELLKVPLFARLIIETIESAYRDENDFDDEDIDDTDDGGSEDQAAKAGVWICPKAIFYVNSPRTAELLYARVNDHFTQQSICKKRKIDAKVRATTKPYIKGILAKSSIPDKRRVRLLNDFNHNKDVRYFIGTYATYAASINLQDKSGKHPRHTFLAPTTKFTNLDQAAGRCWRPKAMSDSYVRMVFVEGLEEELALIDRLCRRKAIQDKYDLGKLVRPPLPGEYTMRLDRTGELVEFTACKFGTNDKTAKMRRDEHARRKQSIGLMRNLWTLYYDSGKNDILLHSIPEEMMDLIMSYVMY